MHRYRQALLQMRDSFFPTDAVGLASPTRNAALPVMISFTVETDGKLPTEHPRVTQSSRLTMARLATLPTLWSTAPDLDAGNRQNSGGTIPR